MQKNKIAIFGDSILDSYSYYLSNRLSPEAPVPVISFDKKIFYPGGASLTATQLKIRGLEVDLYTQIGKDENGQKLTSKLKGLKVFNSAAKNYQTILKNRIIVNGKYYLREDKEEMISSLYEKTINEFKKNIKGYKAIAFVDYNKGYLNKKLFNDLKNLAKENNLKTFLDPHPENIMNFKEIDYIKPNQLEAKKITNKKNIRSALFELQRKYKTTPVVTLGQDGAVTLLNNRVHYSKIYKSNFVDSSGCGDVFFASFLSYTLKNKPLTKSLDYAVKSATESCEHFGYKTN
tara:strand:- start:755 stop:1624 length:870 start_codon:yes stop_codon:yes gene_type:complete